MPSNGSVVLSSSMRSCRALGDQEFHSSCDCIVLCQPARAAAFLHSVVVLHGGVPACCLLCMACRTSHACTARSAHASSGPCVSPCSPPLFLGVRMSWAWFT
eukprot:7942980-Lingulodinium_polyedra.AAC.1